MQVFVLTLLWICTLLSLWLNFLFNLGSNLPRSVTRSSRKMGKSKLFLAFYLQAHQHSFNPWRSPPFPHPPQLIFQYSIISVNSSLALRRPFSNAFDQIFDSNQWQSLVHFMYLVLCKAGCSKQLTKKAFSNWSIQCDFPLLDSWLKSKRRRQIPTTLPLQSNDHSLCGPSYCSKSQLSSLVFCIYSRVSSALCRVCLVNFWKLPQKE